VEHCHQFPAPESIVEQDMIVAVNEVETFDNTIDIVDYNR